MIGVLLTLESVATRGRTAVPNQHPYAIGVGGHSTATETSRVGTWENTRGDS